MSDLVLPAWVYTSLLTEQENRWNPILKAIDPLLRLVPPTDRPPVGMTPERWHIARVREDGHEAFIPIQGPHGEFREMDEAMLETLRRMDSHSPRTRREWAEDAERRARAQERAKAREHAERSEQIAERVESAMRTSVLFPRGVG